MDCRVSPATTNHDPGRDGVPRALSRWPDAGHRQAGGLCRASRAEGRREPGGPFPRAALRPAARAGARAPARPRDLRLPRARPPPQGARRARPDVQAGQGGQDLLGGGRRRTCRGRRPHRAAARPPRRDARLVDEARSEGAGGGDGVAGAGALALPSHKTPLDTSPLAGEVDLRRQADAGREGGHSHADANRHPPPQPSPTRGEGTGRCRRETSGEATHLAGA